MTRGENKSSTPVKIPKAQVRMTKNAVLLANHNTHKYFLRDVHGYNQNK